MSSPKAIVLLSGGIDSSTCLAIAKEAGYQTYALTFHYGQRHKIEIEAAKRVAHDIGAQDHCIVQIAPLSLAGSALTSEVPVPKSRTKDEMSAAIPATYVPARNTLFLSYALGWAEVLGASDVFIGVNALDYAGYPDCRPEFIEAFEQMANLATRASTLGQKFRVHAPLIQLSKAQIIARGMSLGVCFASTHSCYAPSDRVACGSCDACLLRLEGFAANNARDPAVYNNARSPG